MKIRHFLPAFLVSAFLPFNILGTVFYVDLNCTNPVSPYTSWATAATNIQDALNDSGYRDTILVTNGVYQYGGYSYAGSNRVYASNGQTIQSVSGPAFTIIKGYQVPGTTNGPNAVRCVYLQKGTTLSGFTLTNGATPDLQSGGGVNCPGASVTNCVIIGNAAFLGGGTYLGTLVNCKLIGNSAIESGWGGGAYNSTLINCLLTGNRSGYRGGAAYGCSLVGCTIAGNTGQPTSIESCTLTNCISYYNSPDNSSTGQGNNYFNNGCTLPLPSSGVNTITNPPAFLDLADGDFHLNPASPCINAGNNSFITNTTDLDGNPRVVGGTVDIGAYEFQATVHYVNLANPSPTSPFTSWMTAATNIQDAIDAANTGDFVVVSNGTYNVGGRAVYGVATNRVTVDKALTVQSLNGAAVTIIAGSLFNLNTGVAARCVYLTNGAVLSGFTLTNGGTPPVLGDLVREASGGGVWCEDTSAIVSNCVLTGNHVTRCGGGAFQGTLFNCILTNNSAAYGGGTASNTLFSCTLTHNSSLYQNINYGGGADACTLSNCLLVSNQSAAGGGEGGGAAFSALTACVVSNNTAGGSGGGVYFGLANNSLISSNSASSGGGAFSNILNNCVLKNNLAAGDGGGSFFCTLAGCTVVSNISIAGASGGMLGGSATNCIVYYNSASQGGPNYYQSSLSFCDTLPLPTGSGNITNGPAFVNLSGGDFHLQSSSPCINAGNNSIVNSSTDLDGNPRIVGGTVDIGAYEYPTPTSVISYAWLQQYGLPNDGSVDYADLDGTEFNVYQDWIAGLNPTNALSILAMLPPAPTNSPTGLVVSWQSVSNITYFLQVSTNLGVQPAFSTIQSNLLGQTGTTSYTDINATNSGPYFYRVGVQK
ncbi:MAG: choice-of-anchor Q domain-containing protein [Verrucomicrobiota bacterium]|jgi:hypothetical protein